MTRPLVLRGGRIIDPSQHLDVVGDVLVIDGKIEHVGGRGGVPDGAEIIRLHGVHRLAGLHRRALPPARARARGRRDDRHRCACGGRRWIHGGVRDAQHRSRHRQPGGGGLRRAPGTGGRAARVYPIGAISVGQRGEALAEFGEMVGAGAVAVSDDGKPVVERAADAHRARVRAHVRDSGRRPLRGATLADGGAMNEGIVSARVRTARIPE